MTAYALFPGTRAVYIGRDTISAVLLAAERLGARSVRIHVDGGIERFIWLAGEWVAL